MIEGGGVSARGRGAGDGTSTSPRRWPHWFWSRFDRRRDESSAPTSSGLPSRAALVAAVGELEIRSVAQREPIAVVRLRVPAASRITDEDLAEVARVAEGSLPPYARLYEESRGEFILLLPAADAADAVSEAVKLQTEVSNLRIEGDRGVEVLAGISASFGGEPYIFESIALRAEEALEKANSEDGGFAVVTGYTSEIYGQERRSFEGNG